MPGRHRQRFRVRSRGEIAILGLTASIVGGVGGPFCGAATDQRCKALSDSGSWAQITGPYTLTNMINSYNISQGVTFQCKKCSGGVIKYPIEEAVR